ALPLARARRRRAARASDAGAFGTIVRAPGADVRRSRRLAFAADKGREKATTSVPLDRAPREPRRLDEVLNVDDDRGDWRERYLFGQRAPDRQVEGKLRVDVADARREGVRGLVLIVTVAEPKRIVIAGEVLETGHHPHVRFGGAVGVGERREVGHHVGLGGDV